VLLWFNISRKEETIQQFTNVSILVFLCAFSCRCALVVQYFSQRRKGAKAQISHRVHGEIEAQGIFLCGSSCRCALVVQKKFFVLLGVFVS
jgi:hypothetical protein